jgi:tetratricopeptide (TPR) repeat protein
VSQVRLTLDVYSARLNELEEKQRGVLAGAIDRRDEKERDRLQRELVIMNDKLALVADSYTAEMLCYQQVLDALGQVQGGVDEAGLATAKQSLRAGDPTAAEQFLAQLSEQQHPFAARAAFHSGQLAECRVDLQKALDLYGRAVALEPENPQYLGAAGKTARTLYRYKEALAWLESFVRIAREKKGEPLVLALAQRELAYTYVLSGQYQKAGPLYKESMTALAKKLGQEHPEMATSWYQIGELQETLGEYDKAVSLYKKSLEILEKKRGQDHPVLAGILDKLAALCMELELEKQAVPLYERLVRIREKALRPTHPQLALSLNNLAESYRLQGQYAEAEACYQKSLVINETLHGKEHPSVAAILQELAKLCTSQRKQDEAQQYQQRASAIFQKSVEASEKKSGQEALTLEI